MGYAGVRRVSDQNIRFGESKLSKFLGGSMPTDSREVKVVCSQTSICGAVRRKNKIDGYGWTAQTKDVGFDARTVRLWGGDGIRVWGGEDTDKIKLVR